MDMCRWASLREHQLHALSTRNLIRGTWQGIYGFYIPDVRYRCGSYISTEEKDHAPIGEPRKRFTRLMGPRRIGGISVGCKSGRFQLHSSCELLFLCVPFLLRFFISFWILYCIICCVLFQFVDSVFCYLPSVPLSSAFSLVLLLGTHKYIFTGIYVWSDCFTAVCKIHQSSKI